MQKVVAFVVLRPEARVSNEEATQILMEYLKKHVAKYALPASIEFRESLPKTLVGKVAYRILEEEELKKYHKMKTNFQMYLPLTKFVFH